MDLIDRQALLKQIDIDSDGEPGYYGDTWKFIDTIKSMPPAELSTNLAEVGTDCISREQAIDGKICIQRANGVEIYDDYAVPVEYLEQLPPIQPEIVRCKDCKYWVPGYITTDNDDFILPKCGEWQQMVGHSSNDYCSLAERRDDDVTCENCDYAEKFVDGLILCRRTKTSHRVSAISTCGKGKREVEDAEAKV